MPTLPRKYLYTESSLKEFPMHVIRAQAMGFCFGVRDALALVESLADPADVTIHGELVHNEGVLVQLGRRGFRQTPEADRRGVPETPRVLVTAHGISARERTRLENAGKSLIDATCPLVRRVHEAAQDLRRRGYFVLVIGRPGHAEVEGIVGDLDDYAVLADETSAQPFAAAKLGMICQSTTPPALAQRVRRAVERANPGKEIEFIDTICRPTKDRQLAVTDLLDNVDALVVVGGRQSHNTRQLAQLAASRGVPVAHVQGPRDLDAEWLARFRTVGLTAGTSTPDDIIDDVERELHRIAPASLAQGIGQFFTSATCGAGF
jgi:4-hydroxy-3-methylbut-2-enyl diphosphate reductase